MKYHNGDVYEGALHEEMKHGEGVLRFENGDVYTGEFKEEKFHGQGEHTAKEQPIEIVNDYDYSEKNYRPNFIEGTYKGKFVEGIRHGKGEFRSTETYTDYKEIVQEEYKFIGEYKEGKEHGEYCERYWRFEERRHMTESFSYKGGMKEALFHGHGKYEPGSLLNGKARYEGEYKDGKKHGQGKETSLYWMYEGGYENDDKGGTGRRE